MHALAHAVATLGGVGYAPVAPGTVASLVSLPLLPALWAVRARSLVAALVLAAALVALAVWAAGRAESALGHDDARIVVDETAGLVTAGLLLPATWSSAGLAFALFRIFDVAKPFPIGRIDAHVRGGLGIVGDDVVAGLYAGFVAWGVLALT